MATVHLHFPTRALPLSIGSPPHDRVPLLERLIARADREGVRAPLATPAPRWRDRAFRALDADSRAAPPVGPAALFAAQGATHGRWACMASPLNLVAGMTDVTLGEGGLLTLEGAEAAALAAAFNVDFVGTGARLWVGRAAELLCEFDRTFEVNTHDPEDLGGADLYSFQPSGADSGGLRRLMSEIEMWLFDHAVNRDRRAASRPLVTALWLWGGGLVLSGLPAVHGWTAGVDPLFAAFGARAAFPPEGGAGVVTSVDGPGSPAWSAVEREWLAPAAAALAGGRIQCLELSSGSQCFTLRGSSRWRLWRRARPWWESFQEIESDGVE